MSKLGCECGFILSDTAQKIMDKYWGTVIPNGEYFSFLAESAKTVQSFIEAKEKGTAHHWLKEYFSEEYPTDMDMSSYVSDILSACFQGKGLAYGRCEKCGSLKIQDKTESNTYNRYTPENRRSEGI